MFCDRRGNTRIKWASSTRDRSYCEAPLGHEESAGVSVLPLSARVLAAGVRGDGRRARRRADHRTPLCRPRAGPEWPHRFSGFPAASAIATTIPFETRRSTVGLR